MNDLNYQTVREVELCHFDTTKVVFPLRPAYLDATATLHGIKKGLQVSYNAHGGLDEPNERFLDDQYAIELRGDVAMIDTNQRSHDRQGEAITLNNDALVTNGDASEPGSQEPCPNADLDLTPRGDEDDGSEPFYPPVPEFSAGDINGLGDLPPSIVDPNTKSDRREQRR